MDLAGTLVDRLTGLPPGWWYLAAAGALVVAAVVPAAVVAGLWLRRWLLSQSAAPGRGGSGPPASAPVPPSVPVPASVPQRRSRRRGGSPMGQPRRPAGPRARRPFPVGRGTSGRSVPGGED
ncbi:hypothetical protein I0C86_12770 [Plantactinospora sp. S1510]|uniref:Uncharacterized protein n=1 Tax=Plantactinospora alkalitolerans TaxID=2789879 RepID=A0ABS0GUT4_9ACTN|nr:hypothetical protein [Plantactinospora alkalitolerans]MBF9129826.1 hypothetical protein [Plantactinospora alkalitolerans]